MKTHTLSAIPGTAMTHGLTAGNPQVFHASLTPAKTVPVFAVPPELGDVREAVAVTFRNQAGEPIHGGFFTTDPVGHVVALTLVDPEHNVDTGRDPAWTAFGLTMTVGKLLLKPADGGATHELDWSIVDLRSGAIDFDNARATNGLRHQVAKAYLTTYQSEELASDVPSP